MLFIFGVKEHFDSSHKHAGHISFNKKKSFLVFHKNKG